MTDHPHSIGPNNFELWTGHIELAPSLSAADVQDVVTGYVTDSGITVVGYHTEDPPALTLLRWPETREDEGYRSPEIPECNTALVALAGLLGSSSFTTGIVPDGKIHVMMGRKKDGYGNEGEVAPLKVIQDKLPHASITDGYMVSARTSHDGVEPYGERAGIILADPADEGTIHEVGDELEQHHYAIERGPWGNLLGRTDFFETGWSPTYVQIHPEI